MSKDQSIASNKFLAIKHKFFVSIGVVDYSLQKENRRFKNRLGQLIEYKSFD